jgi:hypothetical protein
MHEIYNPVQPSVPGTMVKTSRSLPGSGREYLKKEREDELLYGHSIATGQHCLMEVNEVMPAALVYEHIGIQGQSAVFTSRHHRLEMIKKLPVKIETAQMPLPSWAGAVGMYNSRLNDTYRSRLEDSAVSFDRIVFPSGGIYPEHMAVVDMACKGEIILTGKCLDSG